MVVQSTDGAQGSKDGVLKRKPSNLSPIPQKKVAKGESITNRTDFDIRASASPWLPTTSSPVAVMQSSKLRSHLLEERRALPIWPAKYEIIESVRVHDTVVVLGETGSGKTTQIPQFLNEAGFGVASNQMIGITQPRRVAAVSLAKRVSLEMGESETGGKVGYSIRFDDRTTKKTKIRFMTDGWLLREATGSDDRLLKRYSVLILDEAHERSVNTDVLLGLAKRAQRERQKLIEAGRGSEAGGRLKIVIMSATIDAKAFANFFHPVPVPILYVRGRQHQITLYHSREALQDWIESAKKLLIQIADLPLGDVLVFMTGAEEIESFARDLCDLDRALKLFAEGMGKVPSPGLFVCPLYAALGSLAVSKVYAPTPPGRRKIVLATNIAETSITIPGIRYVIDCGLAKQRGSSSSSSSIEMLEVKPISKSAARQRAGRAGREAPGCCYRLYREDIFESLEESPVPEILRADLTSTVLDVLAMGLNPTTFDWMDRPSDNVMQTSLVVLGELGAIKSASKAHANVESEFTLTEIGKRMASFPLAPSLSRTLIAAAACDKKVATQALNLVSILSSERRSLLVEPPMHVADDAATKRRDEADQARVRLAHPSGDHITQLKVLHAFEQQETASASGIAGGKNSTAAGIKEWCDVNFVSLKSIREVQKIRSQLEIICNGQNMDVGISDWQVKGNLRFREQDLENENNIENGAIDQFSVTRRASSLPSAEDTVDQDNDFSDLLRCLLIGKRANTAFRQADGSYKRALGGTEVFKIHPSSILHSTGRAPPVIFFEELSFTTQIFARGVSACEASWLHELSIQSLKEI